ncbi:dual specificity protein phosphatase 10-like [Neocloeon triangulifer]|uniref:dual specificity protein phosphatase 10-like n=1 Tax=Neocloeon triangulifer TaxID=2078957 RepID=UPI00286F2A6B|nr:dual specificity protein phosphatase 10-like [Neocloeon triangulifer]
MGCSNSKSKNKATLNRLSQYHLAAMEESEGLVKSPMPLEDDLDAQTELMPVKTLHNIFYDGFYAPYVRNPDYLLIVDMRADENLFKQEHILTAKWHGNVDNLKLPPDAEKDPLQRYWHIILYDADGSSLGRPESDMRRLFRSLRDRKLEPCCLEGGLRAIREKCPYLLNRRSNRTETSDQGGFRLLSWFPSIILDGRLFLGRNDQASDPTVLHDLGVSHVICTTKAPSSPRDTSDKVRTLLAPPSHLEAKFKRKSRGPSCLSHASTDTLDDPAVTSNLLTDKMSEMVQFVREAFAAGGKVLVHGELGVDRSAALVMALLMQQCSCSLEDAFYHVKACRPTVQPSDVMLQALAKLEAEIFGKRLTSIEDLCY